MRITAGQSRGHRIKAPRGTVTRPTSERVREALFSILGSPSSGFSILDLFAGSGVLGLEALSRGAATATFVDNNSRATRCIQENAAALGFQDQSTVVQRDAMTVARGQGRLDVSFDWIFADPPYASSLAEATVRAVDEGDLLSDSGVLVVEHRKKTVLEEHVGGLQRTSCRTYGDTGLTFYQRF